MSLFESIPPETNWFSIDLMLRSVSLREAADFHKSADPQRAEKLFAEAAKLFAEAQHAWQEANPDAFVPTSMQKSKSRQKNAKLTQKDKLALLCELLQAPAHFLAANEAVNEIAQMLSTKNTQYHGFLCDTLKELFVSNQLLPLARGLRSFIQQPLFQLSHDKADRARALVLWFFEDTLKKTFATLIDQMREELIAKWVTSDSRKLNTLRFLSELLHRVPEQTNSIAGIIVNKLGDPNQVIASRCSLILLEFMKKQSNEQECIVLHLQKLLDHPSSTEKTQKAIIHIFNQIVFGHRSQKLPALCVRVYVNLFRKRLAEGAIEQRIMNGILTGMKRALPYAGSGTAIAAEIDAIFVMASASQLFHNRVSALNLLLFCLDREEGGFHQRFYRSLYQLIPFDPTHLPQNAQLSMFFALIHKSLAKSHDVRVVAAFVHRMLQAALVNSAAYACATLMTLSDLHKCNPCVSVVLSAKRPDTNAKYFVEAKRAGKDTEEAAAHYMPYCRDPQFAHAATEPAWELTKLMQHYHPTVVKFAQKFASGAPIDHQGNPLDDFSLMHFCELFMHKKPKKATREGMSVHQRQHTPNETSAEAMAFVEQYDVQKKRPKRVKVQNEADYSVDMPLEEEEAPQKEVMKKKACKKAQKGEAGLLSKYLRFDYDAMDGVLLGALNDDTELEGQADEALLQEEAKEMVANQKRKKLAV